MVKDCEADPNTVFNTHPAQVFVDALEALDKLVSGCFGRALCSDYGQRIKNFSECYDKCNFSVT